MKCVLERRFERIIFFHDVHQTPANKEIPMANSYFDLNGPEKVPRPPRPSPASLLIGFASYDEDILRKYCPRFEYGVAIAIGCVAVISMILNAGLFSVAGHALFGLTHFNLGLALAGLVFALLIATIESYGGRSSQVSDGAKSLRSGGLVFPHLRRYMGSLNSFGAYRITIAFLTAIVTTTGVCLWWYAADIATWQSQHESSDNHAIFQQADQAYDRELRRTSDAGASQSALVSDLEREDKRLRQEAVRRSVAATRRGAAAPSPVDNAQLEKFEKRLADEKAKLASLREQSLKQVEGRNAAVAQMIATSPERVQHQDGLIGRLSALHSIMWENPSVLPIVIAIDLLLILLDCAGFIVRLCAPTSVYAGYVAKAHILESVAQAKDCADQLAAYQPQDGKPAQAAKTAEQGNGTAIQLDDPITDPPPPSNDNHLPSSGMNGATPPKRKRGPYLTRRIRQLNGEGKEPSHD
ncbi:DUF4407 domain-containing protein [Bradyrhizobium genosp. A]|uniref:DUF4407 domain-containing protein n=1 Tax=Bradyrhizobium genosp. A TaxID=83626 RepID=UPI003CE79D92